MPDPARPEAPNRYRSNRRIAPAPAPASVPAAGPVADPVPASVPAAGPVLGRDPDLDSDPAADSRPEPDRRWLNIGLVAAGLVLVAGAAAYFWSIRGLADLSVDGQEIINAEDLLAIAEVEMETVALVDGAPLDPNARCYFAPAATPGSQGPFIACGPVWLGVSPDEEPWLRSRISYSVVDEGVIGEVGRIEATTSVEPRTLVRPDGLDAPEPGVPQRPTGGSRLRDGSSISDPLAVIAGAEEAMASAVSSNLDFGPQNLRLADDWRCFLQENPVDERGLVTVDGAAWCGPARTTNSRDSEVWLPVRVRYGADDLFGSVLFEEASADSIRLQAVPEGGSLTRIDGVSPGDASTVDRPPMAPDFAAGIEGQPDLDLVGAGALLLTDQSRVDFAGFARVDTFGSGAGSFTAPEGHDLVVAVVAPSEDGFFERATLRVDGVDRAMPSWPNLESGATLAVVVPEVARSVEMVVENNGRPQTMSLLDGTLAPGYPKALYRADIEPAIPFAVRIEMPVGEAVLIEATLEAVRHLAKDAERNWLPVGDTDLIVEIDGWRVDRPCCEVTVESVQSTFIVVDRTLAAAEPDVGSPIADQEPEPTLSPPTRSVEYQDQRSDPTAAPSRNDTPRFRVPEDISTITLRVEVEVAAIVNDQPQTFTESLEFDLELP